MRKKHYPSTFADSHISAPDVKKPPSQSCKWLFRRDLCCPIFTQFFCPWLVFLLISSSFHFHLLTHTILPYVKKPHSQSCKWPFIRNLCCPIFIPKDWLSSSRNVGFLLISWNFHKTSSSVTGLLSLIMDSGSHLPWSLPTFPVSPHSHSNAATQL